jgi:hypothetical protein
MYSRRFGLACIHLGSRCRKGYFTKVTLVDLDLSVYLGICGQLVLSRKTIKCLSPFLVLFIPLIDPEKTPRLNVSITAVYMFYRNAFPLSTPTRYTCAGARE